MRVISAFVLLAGIVLLASNGLYSQEKKDPPKIKGTLPPGWAKLELTAEQKLNIYKTMAKYKEDIAKMEEKIKEMKLEERREMVKFLTPEQKKKLEEAATGEAPPKK
jgi:Spy/CpxP family protein refolding chaperone